jgi:hypothetical protein
MSDWTGCILGNGEHNYYDDSDFYWVVWDESEGRIREVVSGSTRYAGGHGFRKPDASIEVQAAAIAWMVSVVARGLRDGDVARSGRIREGADVKVVRGRKVPLGTLGRVEWIGQNEYDSNNRRVRCRRLTVLYGGRMSGT